MDNSAVYQGVSRKIMQLMRDTFQDRFVIYYLGMLSDLPPEDGMPCLVVYKPHNDVDVEATGLDQIQERVAINIILNEKDDLGNPSNEIQNTTQQKLEDLVEGRDPITGEWLPGTVMGAVRTHFTLDESTLGNKVSIDYATTPRPDLPSIVEVVIDLTVTSTVEVPDRS